MRGCRGSACRSSDGLPYVCRPPAMKRGRSCPTRTRDLCTRRREPAWSEHLYVEPWTSSATASPPTAVEVRESGISMSDLPDVRLRRIYDDPLEDDGIRVLVDRRWPRGVSKSRAGLDEWCKEVAPSDGLRRWCRHQPEKFEEFSTRYRKELLDPGRALALRHLRDMTLHERLTLLTATKEVEGSQAAVLVELIRADATLGDV